MASIVIPAHNEESVIERCLSAFVGAAYRLQVVVVCNGCTDQTAVIARSVLPSAQVVEIDTASKVAALNEGDRIATVFPRVYLDADVELSLGAVAQLVATFENDETICAAAPTPSFDLAHLSSLNTRFYKAWQRTHFMQSGVIGNGVYALSQYGRRQFDEFPQLLGDDFFVYSLFSDAQRKTLSSAHFVIHPPRNLADLLKVRTRVYFGNAQLSAAKLPNVHKADNSKSSAKQLLLSSRSAAQLLDAVVYLGINVVAKSKAMIRSKKAGLSDSGPDQSSEIVWDRDSSSRALWKS